jgi:chaperonin GroES
MKIQPYGNHVVVKPLEEQAQTASGIILPASGKEKPEQGEVLAVGPGAMVDGARVPIDLKVGARVLFKKYAPDEFTINEEKVLVIDANDVIATLE